VRSTGRHDRNFRPCPKRVAAIGTASRRAVGEAPRPPTSRRRWLILRGPSSASPSSTAPANARASATRRRKKARRSTQETPGSRGRWRSSRSRLPAARRAGHRGRGQRVLRHNRGWRPASQRGRTRAHGEALDRRSGPPDRDSRHARAPRTKSTTRGRRCPINLKSEGRSPGPSVISNSIGRPAFSRVAMLSPPRFFQPAQYACLLPVDRPLCTPRQTDDAFAKITVINGTAIPRRRSKDRA
jgi:hypothetical protein